MPIKTFLTTIPKSMWRAEAIYQQAVCYRDIRESTKAYLGFRAYMALGRDARILSGSGANYRSV